MDQDLQLWPLAKEVLRALGQQYYPVMEARAAEAGMENCDWYLLLPALTFDPETISSAKLRVRVPFYAPHVYEKRLQNLAELGYLSATSPAEDGGEYPSFAYNLTESGRMTIQWIIQAADVAMQGMHPLSLEELEHTASLLRMVVLAAVEAPEPPGKWALNLSRKTDHAMVAPVVVRIDQYLTDLNAYRDDCHLAAWQEHPETGEISPPTWEVLGLLWKLAESRPGEGYSLEEIDSRLERRGHPKRVYAQALKDLSMRGWVLLEGKSYRISTEGYELRQQAEIRTDQYFYRPWNALRPKQLADLKSLLVAIWDGMKMHLNNGLKA